MYFGYPKTFYNPRCWHITVLYLHCLQHVHDMLKGFYCMCKKQRNAIHNTKSSAESLRASCLVPWWVCRAGFVAAVRRWDPIYRCCCVSRSEVHTTWLVALRPRHAVYCWTEGCAPSTQAHNWLHWTISPRLRATTLLSVMIHNKHIS